MKRLEKNILFYVLLHSASLVSLKSHPMIGYDNYCCYF